MLGNGGVSPKVRLHERLKVADSGNPLSRKVHRVIDLLAQGTLRRHEVGVGIGECGRKCLDTRDNGAIVALRGGNDLAGLKDKRGVGAPDEGRGPVGVVKAYDRIRCLNARRHQTLLAKTAKARAQIETACLVARKATQGELTREGAAELARLVGELGRALVLLVENDLVRVLRQTAIAELDSAKLREVTVDGLNLQLGGHSVGGVFFASIKGLHLADIGEVGETTYPPVGTSLGNRVLVSRGDACHPRAVAGKFNVAHVGGEAAHAQKHGRKQRARQRDAHDGDNRAGAVLGEVAQGEGAHHMRPDRARARRSLFSFLCFH